jgi:hypothetical protein
MATKTRSSNVSASILRQHGIRFFPRKGLLTWRTRGRLSGSQLAYDVSFAVPGNPGQLSAEHVLESFSTLFSPEASPAAVLQRLDSTIQTYLHTAQAHEDFQVASLRTALEKALSRGQEVAQVDLELAARFARWKESISEDQRASDIDAELGLADYPAIFSAARTLRRHFVLLVGPTNSGKTHRALEALARASSGAYLAPLRLLALEGQESLTDRGIPTSLITGEERRLNPAARHTASTVEMANFNEVLDCAVIDEAQMLTDVDRGWAWTAAVCGIPAKTIYLVGAPELVERVTPLLRKLGDTWEVHQFERKTALVVNSAPCPPSELRAGDAVIAFSRREVLMLREDLKQAGRSVAVVYGALTPEVRRAEAKRFAQGSAEILIATDAIGMGLNLPIRRVVFSTAQKFDGTADRSLTPSEVKQIAGRAGRYGLTDSGEVTAFTTEALNQVRTLFHAPNEAPSSTRVAIAPSPAHVYAIASMLGTESLGCVLEYFKTKLVREDPLFRTAELDDAIRLAWLTDNVKNLSLETRFSYACAPLDRKNEVHMQYFFRWLHAHAKAHACRLPGLPNWVYLGPSEAWLYEAEGLTKLASVYAWLAYRFPALYPDLERASEQRHDLSKYIESVLARKGKSKSNGKKAMAV